MIENERRLINVSNENVKAVLEKYPYYPDEIWKFTAMTERFPTIDAVPVVRCRECVGRPFWEEDHNGVPVCLLSGLYVRSEDDFCSYGERKEGAD